MVKAKDAALCMAAAAGCLVVAPSMVFTAGHSAITPAEADVSPLAPTAPLIKQSCAGTFGLPLAAVSIAAGAAALSLQRRGRVPCAASSSSIKVINVKDLKPRVSNLPTTLPESITKATGPVQFDIFEVDTFAGGLVGSEYAGWGTYQFDPLMLSARFPEYLPWFREAELKHGRVAMLAFVGLLAPEGFRIPLDDFQGDFDFVTCHSKFIYGLGTGPMWWLLVFCSIIESLRFKEMGLGFEKLNLENAGDLNFGKSFLPKTAEGQTQMRIKELKNGRLAMLAVSGIITQAVAFDVHHFPFAPQ